MKNLNLALGLVTVVALVVACSDDASDGSSPSSGSSGTSSGSSGTSSGSSGTSSGSSGSPSDASVGDASTEASSTDASSAACTDAGGLAPPAIAHAHIDATFTADAAYDGTTAAFTGSDLGGDSTATGAGFVIISNASGAGATSRSINVSSSALFDQACTTIAINGSSVIVRYSEGIPVDRMWSCTSGSIIVDSVDGKVASFHLTAVCPPAASGPGSSALGTVTVTANGIATFP